MDRTATTVWGIHAGEAGQADSLFLRKGVIALGTELECAPDGGQFQAAFLTGCWAWRSSYCAGLR